MDKETYLSPTRNPLGQQAFIFDMGKHYVEYADGVSRCMPYRIAREYADMFGGIVKRHPYYTWSARWGRFKRLLGK